MGQRSPIVKGNDPSATRAGRTPKASPAFKELLDLHRAGILNENSARILTAILRASIAAAAADRLALDTTGAILTEDEKVTKDTKAWLSYVGRAIRDSALPLLEMLMRQTALNFITSTEAFKLDNQMGLPAVRAAARANNAEFQRWQHSEEDAAFCPVIPMEVPQ